jgi:hypothetical protein
MILLPIDPYEPLLVKSTLSPVCVQRTGRSDGHGRKGRKGRKGRRKERM